MTDLQRLLHSTRINKGLSLRDMEKLSDNTITGAYVHLIENKGMKPSPEKLRTLCKILKLDFLKCMVMAGHITSIELRGEK